MTRVAAALLLFLAGAAGAFGAPALIETPSLASAVANGTLPPIAARVPAEPLIVDSAPGTPGGDLHMLMAGSKDTRMMVVYGYARLVGYTPALTLAPDLVKSYEDEDGDRVFTFHLRPGHKWSDGAPFTAEDFRFWFEDVAQNKMISPSGLPPELLVEGEKPRVEFPDPLTVRYSWSRPNPMFLPALAGPDPLFIYVPAHYLKQFHERYAEKDKLKALVKAAKQRNWAALFNKLSNGYRNDNPDLPTLEPWMLRTRPPADRFIFERNPYFHRIDAAGRQLPYIDRVLMVIADSKIIPAKTGAGESDLQARYLRFDNYTFLKEAEERNDFTVRLWRTAPGSQLALYPNLCYNDPVWRKLLRDVRFRRALSLAIDRHEINQAIYYGLAKEGQNTVLPQSPLYKPEFREAWAKFDLPEANRLLDALGLDKRDSEGIRLLPDGQPLQIIVESAGQSTEEADVLELIRDTWREAGIKLFSKPSQLTVFRNRVFSGEAMMAIANGIDNGLVTADMPPVEFAPVSQQQLQWPKWGQYYEDKGHAGEPPDTPMGRELMRLFNAWFDAGTKDQRRAIWENILTIYAEDVPTIGIAAGVPQPVVVNNHLRNVPEEGIWNWDPGAHFGIYHPDHFWFAKDERVALPAAPAAPR
ncbi:MAG TPA: ABC transporter substrate-binding protein [Stellaceae bacterium]|nr:ABC transporter substrate-binding protein [Stellaceae bacterium]